MTDPTGNDAVPSIPATANTGAIAAIGLKAHAGQKIPRKQVISWALWDWATQPFNSVILTFVFTALYLTSSLFLPPEVAALSPDDPARERALAELASGLGLAITIAGLAVLLLAPVLGQRSDASGHRKRWLAINTGLLILCMAAMFFVVGTPSYFVLGVSLVAIANVFSELAGVNYNAMLVQVSTPKSVGKVSGLGWGFGYLGGIIVLLLVYVAFIAGDSHWFGVPEIDGLNIRIVAVACAIWTLVFSLPIFLFVPEVDEDLVRRPKVNFFRSYVVLIKDIGRLWKESRTTFWFLLASAVFRDGLAGVFTFGGVIAGLVFGFAFEDVLVFGIAANLVAGVSTILAGRLDDWLGPRAVILGSLGGLVVTGSAVFLLRDEGPTAFWVGGLVLCLFVGPAQAASRSFLARVTPAGREGEIFGLYATTGRAVSSLAPGLWTLFIAMATAAGLAGPAAYGILGIVLVLAVGFVLMLFVKIPKHERA